MNPLERRGGAWWCAYRLAQYIDDKGQRPTIDELARCVRYDRREIRGTLQALRESGIVERSRHGWDVTNLGRTYLRLDAQQLGWLMVGGGQPFVMPAELHDYEPGDDGAEKDRGSS